MSKSKHARSIRARAASHIRSKTASRRSADPHHRSRAGGVPLFLQQRVADSPDRRGVVAGAAGALEGVVLERTADFQSAGPPAF